MQNEYNKKRKSEIDKIKKELESNKDKQINIVIEKFGEEI